MAFLKPFGRLVLALALAGAGAAWAQSTPIERQVKAAYLYRFAGFVEWPQGSFARADSVLHIGVAGNDALAEQAGQMVAGRSVNGHAMSVRKIRRGDSLAGIHILFIGEMGRAALADLMGAARDLPLLTVSDAPGGPAPGSMIRFVTADERLRFEVALRPVASSGLRISARMLAAAVRVTGAS